MYYSNPPYQQNYGYYYHNYSQPSYAAPVYRPNPEYQGSYPNPSPPPSYTNQNSNINSIYNNNKKITNLQPLDLNEALSKSSYPKHLQDFLKNFIIDEYFGNKDAKVYFQSLSDEKLFVVEYQLPINFNKKIYKVNIFMYIPKLFPNYPPEFYIEKKCNTGLNNSYENEIDKSTFKINIDKICRYNPEKNNVGEIINILKSKFNKIFPIYKDSKNTSIYEIYDKNNLDKSKVNEIKITSDKFNDEQLLKFMRKQTKDILWAKFDDYKQKYKIEQNYYFLKNFNESSKKDSQSSSFIESDPLNQQLESLKRKGFINSPKNSFSQFLNRNNNKKKIITDYLTERPYLFNQSLIPKKHLSTISQYSQNDIRSKYKNFILEKNNKKSYDFNSDTQTKYNQKILNKINNLKNNKNMCISSIKKNSNSFNLNNINYSNYNTYYNHTLRNKSKEREDENDSKDLFKKIMSYKISKNKKEDKFIKNNNIKNLENSNKLHFTIKVNTSNFLSKIKSKYKKE